jgi:hypothetical protein
MYFGMIPVEVKQKAFFHKNNFMLKSLESLSFEKDDNTLINNVNGLCLIQDYQCERGHGEGWHKIFCLGAFRVIPMTSEMVVKTIFFS